MRSSPNCPGQLRHPHIEQAHHVHLRRSTNFAICIIRPSFRIYVSFTPHPKKKAGLDSKLDRTARKLKVAQAQALFRCGVPPKLCSCLRQFDFPGGGPIGGMKHRSGCGFRGTDRTSCCICCARSMDHPTHCIKVEEQFLRVCYRCYCK